MGRQWQLGRAPAAQCITDLRRIRRTRVRVGLSPARAHRPGEGRKAGDARADTEQGSGTPRNGNGGNPATAQATRDALSQYRAFVPLCTVVLRQISGEPRRAYLLLSCCRDIGCGKDWESMCNQLYTCSAICLTCQGMFAVLVALLATSSDCAKVFVCVSAPAALWTLSGHELPTGFHYFGCHHSSAYLCPAPSHSSHDLLLHCIWQGTLSDV